MTFLTEKIVDRSIIENAAKVPADYWLRWLLASSALVAWLLLIRTYLF